MIPLFIAAGVVLFFSLLLSTRIRVTLEANSDLRVCLRILFLRFQLHPRRRTPVSVLRAQRKKEKKLGKRSAKKSKAKQERTKKLLKEKKSFKDIAALIRLICRILKQILRKFPVYFKLKIFRCVIVIGGRDAADAAIKYGAARAAIAYLTTLIEQLLTVKTARDSILSVEPNFLTEESSVDLKLTLSTSIRSILSLAFRILIAFHRRPIKKKSRQTTGALSKTSTSDNNDSKEF